MIASIQGLDLPADPSTPVSVVEPTGAPKPEYEVAEFVIEDEPNPASLALAPVQRPSLALVSTDMEAYDRSTDEHIANLSRNFATMDAAFIHIARNEAKKTLARMSHEYVATVSNGLSGLAEDVAS